MGKRTFAEVWGRWSVRRSARPVLRAFACAATAALVGSAVADPPYDKAQESRRPPVVDGKAAQEHGRRGATAHRAPVAARPDPVRRDLTPAVGALTKRGARVSVAVYDTTTGLEGVYGDDAYDTASVVKVDILAALLLQAQHARRGLTKSERTSATDMVEHSDNWAATALWQRIGGAQGLDTANERLGVRGVQATRDGHWGLTRTTATGQIDLLRAVFDDDSALNDDARGYLRALMAQVEPGQRWGVSAAADDAASSALKNGWLERSSTKLWDINSIGRIRSGGHTMLIAVLSSGNPTQDAGTALVENAARIAVRAVLGAQRAAAGRLP